MGDGPKSDADCIVAANEDSVGDLYKQFLKNLSGQPDHEKELLEEFAAGLQLAKRAKELALGAAQPAVQPTAVAARRRKPADR